MDVNPALNIAFIFLTVAQKNSSLHLECVEQKDCGDGGFVLEKCG